MPRRDKKLEDLQGGVKYHKNNYTNNRETENERENNLSAKESEQKRWKQ